jgi:kynurenine formamidase
MINRRLSTWPSIAGLVLAVSVILVFTSCQPSPPPGQSKPAVSRASAPAAAKSQAASSDALSEPSSSVAEADFFANLEHARLVDLTHPLDADTIYWPTEEDFKLEKEFAGITEKGYYYASNRFTAAEHGGTHVDAPIHFSEEGQTVDHVPLDRLFGPGAVIDVSQQAAADRDYQVTIDDLHRWETQHGKSLDGHIVLLRTGFSQFWPDREKYLGTGLRGKEGVQALRFPGLDPQAAEWLVNSRAIRSIGIDTASIDYGRSQEFQSHRTLFKHSVPALENVTNLEQVPAQGAWIIALPIKIGGGSGGPSRIVALLPEASK